MRDVGVGTLPDASVSHSAPTEGAKFPQLLSRTLGALQAKFRSEVPGRV